MTSGYLLDLDGTLYVGEQALPGAVEAVAALTEHGIPHRFLTNSTRFPRSGLTRRLGRMGFIVDEEEVFTASRAAASWLRDRGVQRISLLLPSASHEDFAEFAITTVRPEAVVVDDLGDGWSFELLNSAFRHLLDGALFVALQKNRYWRRDDGLALDAGPFVAALEYAAGVEAVVIGKPGPRGGGS